MDRVEQTERREERVFVRLFADEADVIRQAARGVPMAAFVRTAAVSVATEITRAKEGSDNA